MNAITFDATIYRDIKFDRDGGGKVTLLFDASQEADVLRLLMMRDQVLRVSIEAETDQP